MNLATETGGWQYRYGLENADLRRTIDRLTYSSPFARFERGLVAGRAKLMRPAPRLSFSDSPRQGVPAMPSFLSGPAQASGIRTPFGERGLFNLINGAAFLSEIKFRADA